MIIVMMTFQFFQKFRKSRSFLLLFFLFLNKYVNKLLHYFSFFLLLNLDYSFATFAYKSYGILYKIFQNHFF